MTDKQIKEARKLLPQFVPGKKTIYTPEQERLKEEIWCREMINSILLYNGKSNLNQNYYLRKYIKSLGAETVQRLCDEQIADFEQAIVCKNVFTDAEGLSYSSIIWADEH